MANSKVIGISVSKGKYEGYDYKNLILHTVRKDQYTEGERAEQIKVKFKNLGEALNLNKTAAEIDRLLPSDFSNLIGKEIICYYDQYRNVSQICVLAPEGDKKS